MNLDAYDQLAHLLAMPLRSRVPSQSRRPPQAEVVVSPVVQEDPVEVSRRSGFRCKEGLADEAAGQIHTAGGIAAELCPCEIYLCYLEQSAVDEDGKVDLACGWNRRVFVVLQRRPFPARFFVY